MGSWLFPAKNAQTTPPATKLRLQTSMQGIVRAIVWGQTRIAGNLIDYLDFKSTSQSASGGKGGSTSSGGKGQSSSQTVYSVTAGLPSRTFRRFAVIGLCEGPILSVQAFWGNKGFHTGVGNFTVFTGSYSQSPWGYLTSNHVTHALNYRGLAYVAQANIGLGNSPELPQFGWEVLSNVSIPRLSINCRTSYRLIILCLAFRSCCKARRR